MANSKKYIVLCGNVVGSGPFTVSWATDCFEFSDIDAAIKHGFTKGRSDDFNIGEVDHGSLVAMKWMDKTLDYSASELEKIETEIGL